MITLDATQQALVDATSKEICWLFEVDNVYLDYDAATGKFTAGNTLYQTVDGVTASATIVRVVKNGTKGRLFLSGVSGTFQDDEIIYETLGPELVNNGSFTANTTGWTAGNDAVLSSEADGQSGNCLKILNGAASAGYAGQTVTVTSGAVYVISAYQKNYATCHYSYDKDAYAWSGNYENGEWNNDSWATQEVTYLETSTTSLYIALWVNSTTIDHYTFIDEVSVKLTAGAALANGTVTGTKYYWSTKTWTDSTGNLHFDSDRLYFDSDTLEFGVGQDYTFKVLPNSFKVPLQSNLSQYGTYVPNELDFTIANAGNTLTASDFDGCSVHLKLVLTDGPTTEIIRQWKYITTRANPAYEEIKFECLDFVADKINGDYPNTQLIDDIFSPYSDDLIDNTAPAYCVAVPFGTAYIPLRVISDTAYGKGYFLGSDDYTFTVTEVTSPRCVGAGTVWASTDADFRTKAKTDRFTPSADWKILYPFLQKMDEASYSGTHDGGDDAATLSDSGATWTNDELIGMRIVNDTDGSAGYITDNDGTTATAILSGGTGNDWDDDDVYHIEASGLWYYNGKFQEILAKFTRSDTSTITDPADVIEFALEDMGIASSDIDSAGTFATCSTTYAAWGLAFNGAFYYKRPRAKVLAELLNSCHSVIDVDTLVKLRTLSKTSRKTLTNANIITRNPNGKGTFGSTFLRPSQYDSGFVSFQESGMPQDVFLKLLVPAKSATDKISSEVLNIPFVQDSQLVQALGILHHQWKYLKEARQTFSTKSNCLALQPCDVITINHANYGGSFAVVIERMVINPDGSIDFTVNKYSEDLDDFTDISEGAVSITTGNNASFWLPVISGPDNVAPGSGDGPHVIPGRLRVGSATNCIYIDSPSGYLSVVTSGNTKARMGNLNGSFGISSEKYGFAAGDSSLSDHYVLINATDGTVAIKGGITITGGSGIASLTDAGSLAVLDTVGASNCDTTIIDGGIIITGLLSSSDWAAAAGVRLDLENKWLKMGGSNVTAAGAAAGVFLGLDTSYKFYVGDGSNDYVKYDGTNVVISLDKTGAALTLKAGADMVLTADDSDPSLIVFDAGMNQCIGCRSTGYALNIWPATPGSGAFQVGIDSAGNSSPYDIIDIRGDNSVKIQCYVSSSVYAHYLANAGYCQMRGKTASYDLQFNVFGNSGYFEFAGVATEDLRIVDAGSTAATEQDWIEVQVGGNTGYIRVFAAK